MLYFAILNEAWGPKLTIVISYRFDVQEDGTWENRKTFAYIAARLPDGKFGPIMHLYQHKMHTDPDRLRLSCL